MRCAPCPLFIDDNQGYPRNGAFCRYLNVIDHPQLGAVQISRDFDEQIFCFCFIGSWSETADAIEEAEKLLIKLNSLGVISEFYILESVFYEFNSYSISSDMVKNINKKSQQKIQIFKVDSIMECISENTTSWETALKSR